MLQDVGLSLFDPSSNMTRPPGAVGCCRLAGLIPHKYLDEKPQWQEPGSLECVPTAAAWKVLLPRLFAASFKQLFFYIWSSFDSSSQTEGLFWYWLFFHSWWHESSLHLAHFIEFVWKWENTVKSTKHFKIDKEIGLLIRRWGGWTLVPPFWRALMCIKIFNNSFALGLSNSASRCLS